MKNIHKCLICGTICFGGRILCSSRCRYIAEKLSDPQLDDLIKEWDEKNGRR